MSLACSVIIALLVINHRDVEQNRCMSSATLFLALYILGYSFEITATNFDTAFVGLIVEYISCPFISPFILLYALSHTGVRVPKPVKVLLFIIPVAQSVLALTSRYHTYYYSDIEFTPPPIFAQLRITGTIIYYICFAYIYIMLIASAIILAKNAVGQKGSKRYTEYFIATAFLIPIVTTTLYLFGLTPWSYDLTPVFLCITCIIICICTLRYNYLQFLPAATTHMVNEMKDSFVVLDANGCFINANISAKRLFPFLKTLKFGTEIPEEQRNYFKTDESEFEFSISDNGRELFYKASVGSINKRGKPVCKTFIFYDITDTKMLINELDQKASYDALTGIFNRATLMRYLYIIQEKSDIENLSSAVLLIDLDDFKKVNDTLGHEDGNIILAEAAKRITSCLDQNDVIGRYGGEEFCVAFWDKDQNAALKAAENIRAIIEATPFTAAGLSFPVTASIGISLYLPIEEKKIETVLTEADEALSVAKQSGKNCCNIYYKSQSLQSMAR
jgi:diguanylate cyclase (GGDEF)-like protein